jgi:hypothetical protein
LAPLPADAGSGAGVAEADLAGIGVFDFGDMVETARICNLVRQLYTNIRMRSGAKC